MPLAARIGDLEACPSSSGAPIATGASTVFIEGRPAARVGDAVTCGAGGTKIESGSPTVTIEGAQAARITDTTCHGGRIVSGAAAVFIGNGGGSGGGTLGQAHRTGAPFVRG